MITDTQHPHYGIRLKMHHALVQIQKLNDEMDAYLYSKPFITYREVYEETNACWEVLKLNKFIDPTWNLRVGEIIHQLRSVLDHLVFLMVPKSTEGKTNRTTQFPIYHKNSDFTRDIPKKLKGMGDEGIEILREMQPHTGEGKKSPLWILAEMSNLDKHREIILATTSIINNSTKRTVTREDVDSGFNNFDLIINPGGIFEEKIQLFGCSIPSGPESIMELAAKLKIDGTAIIAIRLKRPIEANIEPCAQEVLKSFYSKIEDIVSRICNRLG